MASVEICEHAEHTAHPISGGRVGKTGETPGGGDIWEPCAPGQYRTLNDGDVVRVVIAEVGIEADYRVVVEPDLEQDDVWHYTLRPVLIGDIR